MKNILELKNKKGQLSLASGIIFSIVGFIIISLVALLITGFLTTSSSSNGGFFGSLRTTYTVTNETGTVAQGKWINLTGYTLAQVNATTNGYVITQAWNNSNTGAGNPIPATNYTVSASGVVTNTTTATPYNNWNNVSFSYTYTDQSPQDYTSANLGGNLTSGVNTIGGKFSTIFTVLGVLIVLGIVGLLILVVSKYRGGGGSFGGGSNFGQ